MDDKFRQNDCVVFYSKKTFIICGNISNDLHRALTQLDTTLHIPPVIGFQNLFLLPDHRRHSGNFSVFSKILFGSVDSTHVLALVKCLRPFAIINIFPFSSTTDYLRNEPNDDNPYFFLVYVAFKVYNFCRFTVSI